MLWNVRCEDMTPSDLWKTDIKANSQMSHFHPLPSFPPSLLSLPAELWHIKGTESPSAFKRKVKRSTFLVRFWKWSHLKAICLRWNLTCHGYRELSLHGASADGDRHPSPAAFTNTLPDVLQACWTVCFASDLPKTHSGTATSAFSSLIPVVFRGEKKI